MVGRKKGSVKTDIDKGFVRKRKRDFETEEEYIQYKIQLKRYKNAVNYDKNKDKFRERAKQRYNNLDDEQRRDYIAKLNDRIKFKYHNNTEFRERHLYYDKQAKQKQKLQHSEGTSSDNGDP